MGSLKIKLISLEDALALEGFLEITLKRDGILLKWNGNDLISPMGHVRSDRFPHIVESLEGFPECLGEMYIEGGKVYDIMSKENWSQAKFMPIYFSDVDGRRFDNSPITRMVHFDSVQEGWDYVLNWNEEGLVIRVNCEKLYKVKQLHEDKVRVVDWIPSKTKGTFVLENGNKVSGTKMAYVAFWKKNKGCMAEIEYPYLTANGKYFQPRLRRVYSGEAK